MIIRIKKETEKNNNCKNLLSLSKLSWKNSKDFDKGWDGRYAIETKLIQDIVKHEGVKRILELGSGPGRLSQRVMKATGITDYTLVDLESAKKLFNKRKYKGKFIVKDLENFFDVTGVGKDFDLIIMNDFLEHIRNPSHIISSSKDLLKDEGVMLCSIPNWKMGHSFFYRGLFDFDNFIYFMFFHGLSNFELFKSNLQTMNFPMLQSESGLPEGMRRSWNIYCLFKKNEVFKNEKE